jgi:transcription elongation factor Elf1
MSEKKAHPPVPTALDVAQIFNDMLPSFRCNVCRHDRMAIIDKLDSGRVTSIVTSNASNEPQQENDPKRTNPDYVRVATIACRNCGYIHQFALQYLMDAKPELVSP